jgi:hypothetical protein
MTSIQRRTLRKFTDSESLHGPGGAEPGLTLILARPPSPTLLLHNEWLIPFGLTDLLHLTIRPSNLYRINSFILSQTKAQAVTSL